MVDDVWTGQGPNGNLEDPCNWSLGTVPGAGSTAVFNSGSVSVHGSIVTVGSGPETTVPITSPTQPGVFNPSVVSVAAGASVTFGGTYGARNYIIQTLDIGNSGTISFVGSDLRSETVDVGSFINGQGPGTELNLGNATPITNGAQFIPFEWSAAHGFGSVALSAVIGALNVGEGAVANIGSNTIAANIVDANQFGMGLTGSTTTPGPFNPGKQLIPDPNYAETWPEYSPPPGSGRGYGPPPAIIPSCSSETIVSVSGGTITIVAVSGDRATIDGPGQTTVPVQGSSATVTAPVGITTVSGSGTVAVGGGVATLSVRGGIVTVSDFGTVTAAGGAASAPTSAAPCFATGTAILTVHGEVSVERLRPGMLIRTQNGRPAAVRWIGRRTVRVTEGTAPILIRTNALAERTPFRDVRLSPDHAVLIGGVLIPAHRLRNGATISQDMSAGAITYWHVELDRHAVLFADGLPAESYLDTGNRRQFDAEFGVRPLHQEPSADPLAAAIAAYAAHGCAPLCLNGAAVESAHVQLVRRASLLGWQMTDDPALEITADVPGVSLCADDERAFLIPAKARSVRIVSRRFVPAEMDATRRDGRRLGVAVSVRCDGAALPERSFDRGWYAPEEGADWRWTDGDARLLIASRSGPCMLRIDVVATGACYWQAAPSRRAARRVARI